MSSRVAEGPVKYTYECLDCGATYDTVEELEEHIDLNNFIIEIHREKEGTMSDESIRMRVTLDLPVDPSTASKRVIKAIASEQRDYTQVVLVKDREVTLTDHVEVIDVHAHVSTPDQACAYCVQNLAMDERR